MTAGERLIQQGIQEGILVGERRILLRQVRVRFGDQVDAEIERRIETASAEQFDLWVDRVFSATSLAELLAD
jgi:hypothetical protein